MSEQKLCECVTAPAKGWRNVYWLSDRIIDNVTGHIVGPGRTVSTKIWPSRDVAETMAHSVTWLECCTYLGAEPLP